MTGKQHFPTHTKKQQQPQQEYNKVGDVINKNYRLTNLFLVPFAGVAYSLSDVKVIVGRGLPLSFRELVQKEINKEKDENMYNKI